jgi:hypothetical protein
MFFAESRPVLKTTSGGARRDRTADLLHAMQALSQLSYGPTGWKDRKFRGRVQDRQATFSTFFTLAASRNRSVATPWPLSAR